MTDCLEKVTARQVSQILLLLCLGFVLFAIFCEYWFKIKPCSLCYYERYVFMAIAFVGLLGRIRPMPALYLQSFLLAVGAALTFYHIGVEHHWWQAPTSCGGGSLAVNSVEELKRQVMNAPIVRCDKPGWIIFGVSAVTWTFLVFLGLFSSMMVYICRCCCSKKEV